MRAAVPFLGALLFASAAAAQQPPMPPGHPVLPAEPAPTPAPTPAPNGAPTAAPNGAPTPAPNGAQALPPGHPAPTAADAPLAADPGQLPPGHPSPPPAPGPAGPDGAPTQPAGPAAQQAAAPPGGESQRRLQEVLRPPDSGTAEASSEVPAGSVRVTVVDPTGRPVADAAVDMGSLASGERSRFNARTDANGIATFSDLPTGSAQAYRVNVPNGGATFSTTPFQLPTDRGFDVRLTRYEITRDPRFVFFHVFRVIAEQRGERMHIIHQAELSNAGDRAFVFDEDYADIELPEGYVNFRFQRVITDQRIEEIDGGDDAPGAYAIRGSMPPGTVRLAWAYEMPISDTEMSVPVQIPLRFYGLQVLAEALPELELSVQGMPNADRLDPQGAPCVDSTQTEGCAWVTMVRRGPGDPALRAITMRLTGIPGPSPVRWVAIFVAMFFVLAGAFAFLVGPSSDSGTATGLSERKEALLAEAEELEADFEAGDIGPEFRQRRKQEIVRELAGVLHRLESAAEGDAGAKGGSLWLGLTLGLLLGPFGLVYVGQRANEPLTRRGAGVGFALQLVVGALAASYVTFTA